jgi:mannose-1-phosphate guanylyltransferase
MEKMKNVHGLLAPFQWSDLGGWPGIAQFWPKVAGDNRVSVGRVGRRAVPLPIFLESRGNLVKADDRLVALLGTENLLVVDTPDALLICPRSKTEKIREVVRELERKKAKEYL